MIAWIKQLVDLRLALQAAILGLVGAPVIWWYVRVRLRELAEIEAAKFRSLLDAAPEGVLGVSEDGRIRFANAEAQRLFQYAEADLVGQPIELLIPERYARTHIRSRSSYLTGPCKRSMGSGLEVMAQRKDGSEFPADVSLNHVRTGNGAFVISMIRDVTAQRQHRAALLEANRKLQAGLAENMRHAEQMRQLRQLAQELQLCRNEEELYACVARGAARLFPDHPGALYITGQAGVSIDIVATWGLDASTMPPCTTPHRCGASRGVSPSAAADAEWSESGERTSVEHSGSYDCVPMLSRGETLGALHLGREVGAMTDMSDKTHLETLQTIADQVGLSLANLRLREALRLQSICDPLTKLYNRRFMDEWLARELPRTIRGHRPISLLMLDLDHFKRFNDEYGHECGDLVLREVAALLRATVRQSDIACRIGGEELVLLLPETKLADALCIAEKLRGLVAALAVTFQGKEVGRITVSIGAAESPRHGHSPALLLRAADMALYQAKSAGRDRVAAAADTMIEEISKNQWAPLPG